MSSDVNQENLEVLCRHCGETLTSFLKEMAEKNSKIVCPACGQTHEHGSAEAHSGPAA
jgi:DNA-directed RNA polymerase subunit RPC12/RpoP